MPKVKKTLLTVVLSMVFLSGTIYAEPSETVPAEPATAESVTAEKRALGKAVIAGNIGQVQTLLSSEVAPNWTNNFGWTPLMLAVQKGYLDIVTALLEGGADPNYPNAYYPPNFRQKLSWDEQLRGLTTDYTINTRHDTALILAVSKSYKDPVYKDIIEILLLEGADPNLTNLNGTTALLELTRLIFLKGIGHWTAVGFEGSLGITDLLIMAGADLDAQDDIDGYTSLVHMANCMYRGRVCIRIANRLLKAGANPYVLNSVGSNAGGQAKDELDVWGMPWNWYVYKKVQNDIIKGTYSLWSELTTAIDYGNDETVVDLIRKGADPNAFDKGGRFPLGLASLKGDEDIVSFLLYRTGADVNLQDEEGWTALMIAVYKGHEDLVKLLLSAGADINLQDEDAWTALMIATSEEHEDLVKLLLSAGADTALKNDDGQTALDIAKETGHSSIVKLLEEGLY